MVTELYKGWSIQASSRLADDGLIAFAIVELPRRSDEDDGGCRYIFNDLGVYMQGPEEAERGAAMWARKWIDDNCA
jgi:hypothetical protein